MSTEGIDDLNEGGELFTGHCAFNDMHKRRYEATWVSPERQRAN